MSEAYHRVRKLSFEGGVLTLQSKGITATPLLPQFNPTAKTIDEIKEIYAEQGFSLLQPDDVARTIVWLLSEDSRPVYGADINVGAPMP